MSKHQQYFKVAAAMRKIMIKEGLAQLDFEERAILEFIGVAQMEGRVLNVSNIVRESGIGTAPTVYKYIASLKQRKMIELKSHPDDGRQYRVFLSARAQTIYSRLAKALAA